MDSKYAENMLIKRRVRTQFLAIMQRAERAGIPPSMMRIGPQKFSEILSEGYHGQPGNINTKNLVEMVYEKPKDLFKRPFIVIDSIGVGNKERKMAGFAILFRMIACDYSGRYISGNQMCHQLEDFKLCNDLTSELKKPDVLLIGEFSTSGIKTALNGASFIDEIIDYRETYGKLTIICMCQTLSSHENLEVEPVVYGRYITSFMHSDRKRSQDILRIRVGSETH